MSRLVLLTVVFVLFSAGCFQNAHKAVDTDGVTDSTAGVDTASGADSTIDGISSDSDTGPTDTSVPTDTDTAASDTPAADDDMAETPDTAVIDTETKDDAAADTVVNPDTSVPDTVKPDTTVPDTAVPDSATPDTAVPDADMNTGDMQKIRFVAANLTSGNGQSYDPGDGINIMKSLKGDIFMVQEFNYKSNTDANYKEMTAAVCGSGCFYSVGVGDIPNGVISRWTITAHGAWDDPYISNRDLDWARIDIPGNKDLFVVSVHLHTSPSSDQVGAAQVVAKKVLEYKAANPNCCYYIVGGDFNGPSSVSDNGFGKYNNTDVFWVDAPHPVGEDGVEGTNANRNSQYDFVLFDHPLHAYQIPVVFTAVSGGGAPLSYANGLVFDTRDFSQTELDSYFPPAQTGDSAASSMQHMGIVKDVSIPK